MTINIFTLYKQCVGGQVKKTATKSRRDSPPAVRRTGSELEADKIGTYEK